MRAIDEVKLIHLCGQFIAAKAIEAFAKSQRAEVEAEIATMIPLDGAKQKTVDLPGVGKVTVKGGVNYSAETDAMRQAYDGLRSAGAVPADGVSYLPLAKKVSEVLDGKGYEWLRKNQPNIFACISQFVTVTPKKPSVIIKS